MSQCDNLPTLQQLENTAVNSQVFNEVLTSRASFTPTKATDGESKRTFYAMQNEYEGIIENVAGQTLDLTQGFAESAEDSAQSAASSAQSASDSAQSASDSATQASEIAGLDTVEQAVDYAMSNRRLPEPDVSIPFNDSVELERGYGNRDSNGNRAVDFSRASGSQYVNKSGEMKQLVTDEPAITSDGIGIFGEFTNELLNSEDVSQWKTDYVASVTQDGTLSSDGVNQAWLVNSGGGTVRHTIGNANPAGEFWLMSVDVKQVDSAYARLQWNEYTGGEAHSKVCLFDFSAEEIDKKNSRYADFEKLNDGWYRIYIGNTSNDSGNQYIRFDVAPSNDDNIQGSLYVSKGSIVRNAPKSKIPYVKTESTPVTRGADIVELPTRGNIPAYGKPFTIMLDAAVPFTDGMSSVGVFIVDTIKVNSEDTIAAFAMRRAIDQGVQVFLDQKNGVDRAIKVYDLGEKQKRFVMKFSGTLLSFHVNGVKRGEVSTTNDGYPIVDFDGLIKLGSFFGDNLDSHIKNFKIYHTALTDEQIAALGGPDV